MTRRAMGFHYYNVTIDQKTLESLEKTAAFLKSNGVIDEIPDWDRSIGKTYFNDMFTSK